LVAIGIVNCAVIAMHRKMPNLRRPFKILFYPVTPLVGALACWVFVPTLEVRSLMLGTGLTAVGFVLYLLSPQNRSELRDLTTAVYTRLRRLISKWRSGMRVLIIGGGEQGANIADRLASEDEFRMVFRSSAYQITFVEQDPDRCDELASRYNVPIFQGDGTKESLLQQTDPHQFEVAITATGDDETNAMAALQARRLGIERVIAIVRDSNYVPLLEDHGIVCMSAPYATAAMVENHLDRPEVAELFEIESGVASLIDMEIPKGGRVVGRAIKDIDVPDQCVVAALIRDDNFVVPRGSTEIQAGDHVVFVGPDDAIQAAREIFSTIREG
jgi:Trk K+ transport system NAD-binding subunit